MSSLTESRLFAVLFAIVVMVVGFTQAGCIQQAPEQAYNS